MPDPSLLTAREVAAMCGISPSTVYAHAVGRNTPKLPSLKIGKSRRFRPDAVNQWLAACEAETERAA